MTKSVFQSLANIANIKSSLTRSVFNGNGYYAELINWVYNKTGSGYKLNDVLTDPYNNTYNVVATDTTGSIIGLQQFVPNTYSPGNNAIGYPFFGSSPPYNKPWAFSGGSGTGFSASADFGTLISASGEPVETQVNYNFTDYSASYGSLTNLTMIDGGLSFVLTESFHVPPIPLSCSVTAVGPGGVITSFAIEQPPTSSFIQPKFVIPTNYNSLPSTSSLIGHSASFQASFMLEPNPYWRSELNRMRNDINSNLTNTNIFPNGVSPTKTCISGPWPVANPTDNWSGPTKFYYTGSTPQYVTINSSLTSLSYYYLTTYTFQMGTSYDVVAGGWGYQTTQLNDTLRFGFVVGGTGSVYVSGSITYIATCFESGRNTIVAPPNNPPHISETRNTTDVYSGYISVVESNIPGAFSMSFSTGMLDIAYVTCTWTIMDYMLPSTYSAILVSSSPQSDDYSVAFGNPGNVGDYQVIQPRVYFDVRTGGSGATTLQSLYTIGPGQTADGICNNAEVNAITFPYDINTLLGPVLGYYSNPCLTGIYDPPFPTASFDSHGPKITMASVGWSATCDGLWTALTQPINQVNVMTFPQMPHNFILESTYLDNYSYNPMLSQSAILTQSAQTYDVNLPVESQLEPQHWADTTWYYYNAIIVDSNYNWQQCISAGISGLTAPTFGSASGQVSSDLQWKCIHTPIIQTSSWKPNHYL